MNRVRKFAANVVVVTTFVMPTLVDVAWARETRDRVRAEAVAQTPRQLDRLSFSQTVVGKGGETNLRSVSAAILPHENNDPQSAIVDVAQNGRAASVRFDGETIRFSDGYTATIRVVVDNARQTIRQVDAETPDHRRATATLVLNHASNTAEQNGLERVRELLSGSDDLQLLAAVLPAAIAMETRSATSHDAAGRVTAGRVHSTDVLGDMPLVLDVDMVLAAVSLWGCIGAILAVIGSFLVMIAACGAPEPAQPLVCYGSLLLFLSAAAWMMDSCFGW